MNEVIAISNAIGNTPVELNNPTPLEASAAIPIWVHPNKADALPMLRENGASDNAAAFGLINPKQDKQIKNKTNVL